MSMDLTIKTNIKEFLKSLPVAEGEVAMTDAEIEAYAAVLQEITMSMVCDMETGNCFYTTNINALIDEKADDNTWFKMNLFDVYDMLGIDIKGLMQESLNGDFDSMAAVLDAVSEFGESSMTVSTYSQMQTVYDAMKAILGDSALKVTKLGTTTVYTSDFKTAFTALGATTEDLQGVEGKLIMTDKDGAYSFCIQFGFEMPEMINISMDIDSATTKTDKVLKTVPADAKIIDVDMSALEIPAL